MRRDVAVADDARGVQQERARAHRGGDRRVPGGLADFGDERLVVEAGVEVDEPRHDQQVDVDLVAERPVRGHEAEATVRCHGSSVR